ncbi:MAG: hypothetical protein DMD89_23820 [Candidatus Rokuibacteriota bacterium]|nr:MAG: hypothetical protein DMD89_23820 [Candidatus Rokubacteria bacterium]
MAAAAGWARDAEAHVGERGTLLPSDVDALVGARPRVTDNPVCTACKRGTLEHGTTTATIESEGTTVVIRNVPAEICSACGEGYFDPITADRLLELASEAAGWSGAPFQICDYE